MCPTNVVESRACTELQRAVSWQGEVGVAGEVEDAGEAAGACPSFVNKLCVTMQRLRICSETMITRYVHSQPHGRQGGTAESLPPFLSHLDLLLCTCYLVCIKTATVASKTSPDAPLAPLFRRPAAKAPRLRTKSGVVLRPGVGGSLCALNPTKVDAQDAQALDQQPLSTPSRSVVEGMEGVEPMPVLPVLPALSTQWPNLSLLQLPELPCLFHPLFRGCRWPSRLWAPPGWRLVL